MSNDPLMPSSAVRKELGDVSAMTIWRWQREKILPAPVKINGRNYWSKSTIDNLKAGGKASQ